MKKLITTALFTSSMFLAFTANASLSSPTTCTNIRNPDQELLLYINNGNLEFVRVHTQGSLPKGLLISKLADQNTDGVTLFRVSGVASLLEIDNSVLNENDGSGRARLEGESFDCLN